MKYVYWIVTLAVMFLIAAQLIIKVEKDRARVFTPVAEYAESYSPGHRLKALKDRKDALDKWNLNTETNDTKKEEVSK